MTRRWDFISASRAVFGVKRICQVLRVSRSGCCRWAAGAAAREARQAGEDALVAEIREIHAGHNGTYGVRWVHAELRGFGHTVHRKRVERLMRREGTEGRHLRRRKRTTIPGRLAPPAPDLVQRDFTAAALDEKWCGDITYVQAGGAWLCLACVLDICSRRVLGWSMATHMSRARRRRTHDGVGGPRRPRGRSDLPRGQGTAIHLSRVRPGQRPLQHPAEHGQGRLRLRQCPGRIALAGTEERSDAGGVRDGASGQAGDLPVAHLLQRPPTPQQPRLSLTRQVRTTVPART